ncbi:MAG: transposase [Patescibacteria group bacterium]
MQKPQFVENEIYHIFNRGVEKRKTFLDDKDYLRFIHDLFEFNNEDFVYNVAYYFNNKFKKTELERIKKQKKPRKLLVEILAFTLMPNHFHLLLKQKKENGIVKFMQKLGTGYTNYFNKKYERVGGLFQGRFKAIFVNEEIYFSILPFYIHTNPIDLIYGSSTPIDWKTQIEFLENYRWSSYLDYIGKKNFPSLTSRDFILDFFGGEKEYYQQTKKWLREKSGIDGRNINIEKIKKIILE